MSGHRVEFDHAGWGGYPRWTCHACSVTLLRKPFHTEAEWSLLRERFLREHPQSLSSATTAAGPPPPPDSGSDSVSA